MPIKIQKVSDLPYIDSSAEHHSLNHEIIPWETSIVAGHQLTFMPYFSWASDTLNNLTNLRQHPQSKYDYKESTPPPPSRNGRKNNEKARIYNESYESDEYRKIRMTYYDAGEIQVFNSLYYPRANLPLLGIDLIQFRDRYLVVIDFQPLDEKKEVSELEKIRDEMPEILKGKMSKRFYDEDKFFSDQMLFGRFGKEEAINNNLVSVGGHLWVAFQKYVTLHYDMAMQQAITTPSESESCHDDKYVLERQREYDVYSAERDPAHALFVKAFGKDFADGFVYDFLFSLSGGPQKTQK